MNLTPFKISNDYKLLDEQNNITPYVSSLLSKLYIEIPKNKPNTLKKLLKYIAQFPQVPTFKNYLSIYYSNNGNIEKTTEINLEIIKEHPNYLYGKINRAAILIDEKKFNEIEEILGENLLLHELFPNRNEFHIDEFFTYYATTIKYFYAIDMVDEANKRLIVLEKIDEEHPKYLMAKKIKQNYLFKKMEQIWKKGKFDVKKDLEINRKR